MRFLVSPFSYIFPILPYKNVFAITCVKTTQMSSFFQWIIIWWMWTYPECILKIWVDDVIFWRHYIFPHFRGLKHVWSKNLMTSENDVISSNFQNAFRICSHLSYDNPLKKWRHLRGFNTSNRKNVFVFCFFTKKRMFCENGYCIVYMCPGKICCPWLKLS